MFFPLPVPDVDKSALETVFERCHEDKDVRSRFCLTVPDQWSRHALGELHGNGDHRDQRQQRALRRSIAAGRHERVDFLRARSRSRSTRGAGHEWPTQDDEDAEPRPDSEELVARRGFMLANDERRMTTSGLGGCTLIAATEFCVV